MGYILGMKILIPGGTRFIDGSGRAIDAGGAFADSPQSGKTNPELFEECREFRSIGTSPARWGQPKAYARIGGALLAEINRG